MAGVSTAPVHASASDLDLRDGRLHLGGQSLTRLAARAGQTPFYVYDRTLVRRRVTALRAALPPAVHLHYAIKANPMPALVQLLHELVDGFDVASLHELHLALDTGAAAAAIGFAGPGKTPAALRAAVAAGCVVNAESCAEIEALAAAGDALGLTPTVAVRVNPDFQLKHSGMTMTGRASAFGIDAAQVPQALRRIGALGLDFEGLHLYAGSQNLRAEAIVECNTHTFELALTLAEHAPGPLRSLNIGGGYGIPYFPGERALDPAPIGANLERWLAILRQRLGAVRVIVELGRYLVGEAGAYVCRVVDRKVSKDRVILVCDGGLHHHLANSGNLGQVIRRNYPLVVEPAAGSRDETETVTLAGPLCTPLDVLAENVTVAHAPVGSLVAILQSGAYGLSASPQRFLGHPPAVEILV